MYENPGMRQTVIDLIFLDPWVQLPTVLLQLQASLVYVK